KNIIPIFVYDRNILEDLPADDARITLIHHLLNRVNSELREYGTSLATFHGAPQEVLLSVALECKATAVFTNRDYEPYAQKRDIVISTKLEKHNISFHTFKDQVIFEKDEIT